MLIYSFVKPVDNKSDIVMSLCSICKAQLRIELIDN